MLPLRKGMHGFGCVSLFVYMQVGKEKMYKFDYTDVLIWLGIAIIVLWMISKIVGLIP
jgi:hypothetical protein